MSDLSGTLTIRNLDEGVKQKLREQVARHQRSMEAEARELLARAWEEETLRPPRTVDEMKERLEAVRGIWNEHAGGRDSDEIMREIRDDD